MRINQLTVWVALALGTMSAQSAVTDKMIEAIFAPLPADQEWKPL